MNWYLTMVEGLKFAALTFTKGVSNCSVAPDSRIENSS